MRTRSSQANSSLPQPNRCVYCGGKADTDDHSPPRCLLRRPLPSNVMTLRACQKCNCGFSIDENVVKTLISLVSTHPELAKQREPGGRVYRALARDRRLRSVIDSARNSDGNYELTGQLLVSVDRVMRKTIQGLFFGLYERFVSASEIEPLWLVDQRFMTADQVIDQVRPSPLRDITDEQLPAITPASWPVREPIFFITMKSAQSQERVQRIFRLVRETPVEWVEFQPDVFRFAFVRSEDGRAVCILDLWKSLLVVVAAPWPDRRGPLRRGKRNPLSRERRRR